MVKQAPTPARLLVMVVFALSCFGLLMFLWLAFGGPVPLQPKGYRVQIAFPEATQLAKEADVRVAGVSVGTVRDTALDPDQPNRTVATLELEPKYAPLAADARATLRQKTLLGETYVELTLGTRRSRRLREGEQLAPARVADTVELDEIFQALDPRTRKAFQGWQAELADSIRGGRGTDLNDALGTLPTFADDGDQLLSVLDTHEEALTRLVRNTGVVFGAVTEDEGKLRGLVQGSAQVFRVTSRREQELAATFRAFPTFLDESRATFSRLDRFARDTRPLVQDLRPVARDLRPALADLQAAAPDLERVFRRLGPLIDVSQAGLPALRDTLDGLRPVLEQTQPFLEQLNPILEWLEIHQRTVADFLANGAGALADTVPEGSTATSEERGHYLRQFGPKGAETAAMYTDRAQTPTARGNAYLPAAALSGPERARRMMFPNWDCKNTGEPGSGEYMTKTPDTNDKPSCWVAPLQPVPGGGTARFPHVEAADYSRP